MGKPGRRRRPKTRQIQNDQPRTDRGRRAPQSEYDYLEDNYIYADGDYDGAYYYDEEYSTGGEGPSRGDQSLVSPEITPEPTTARPATTPYYVPTVSSYTET